MTISRKWTQWVTKTKEVPEAAFVNALMMESNKNLHWDKYRDGVPDRYCAIKTDTEMFEGLKAAWDVIACPESMMEGVRSVMSEFNEKQIKVICMYGAGKSQTEIKREADVTTSFILATLRDMLLIAKQPDRYLKLTSGMKAFEKRASEFEESTYLVDVDFSHSPKMRHRILNGLYRNGFASLEELQNIPVWQICRLRNMGKMCFETIGHTLEEHHLKSKNWFEASEIMKQGKQYNLQGEVDSL